jgi:hypothetical protein
MLIVGVGRSAFIGGRRAPAVIRAGGVWARRWGASCQQQQSDKEYEFHGFFSFCGWFRSLSLSNTSRAVELHVPVNTDIGAIDTFFPHLRPERLA